MVMARRNGFTLVELSLALLCSGLLLAGLAGVLRASLDGWALLDRRLAVQRELRTVRERLGEDLRQASRARFGPDGLVLVLPDEAGPERAPRRVRYRVRCGAGAGLVRSEGDRSGSHPLARRVTGLAVDGGADPDRPGALFRIRLDLDGDWPDGPRTGLEARRHEFRIAPRNP
jgi:type II secretory pathway pseudopilin PulG